MSVIKFHGGGRWSGEYCYMTLLTRHKTKDSPYFQMKIIILIALQGVKFPEGGAAAPVAPPWIRPWLRGALLVATSLLKSNTKFFKFFIFYQNWIKIC